jgi:processive 1,2-diacylglycerol beta-glucosyltransferase
VDETVEAAIALGMPKSNVWRGGFMLSPAFYDEGVGEDGTRQYIQEQLGLDPDEFILLLATGAAGANNHLRILRHLERRGKAVQVVALCGHNGRTFAALERWKQRASAVRLAALRYRNDMPRILRSVSAVVARPGTGTTSEAILSGCPIIMNGIGGVMPQESITVRFGVRHGVAGQIRTASEVGDMLDSWERNPDAREELRHNMISQRPARHPREILEKATGCRIFCSEQALSDCHARQMLP